MEREDEIRKLLGNNYHLSTHHGLVDGEWKCTQWVLFRKYDDTNVYFSNDNEHIMCSEENTEEELYEYAKKHHEIDWYKTRMKVRGVALTILLILAIINMFLLNKFISNYVLISEFWVMLGMLLDSRIYNHNWKVKMRIHRETFEKHLQKTLNQLDETFNDKKTKPRKRKTKGNESNG